MQVWHAGEAARSLLAEQTWRYLGVCFGFLPNQHVRDSQLSVLKVRTLPWSTLLLESGLELPYVCLPAGLLQTTCMNRLGSIPIRGQSHLNRDAINASVERKSSGYQLWNYF